MQKNRKVTILVSVIIVLFVFIVIGIVYQYVQLNLLTKELLDKKQNALYYQTQTTDINAKIEEVETDEYIEKWARSELGWVKETETKVVY